MSDKHAVLVHGSWSRGEQWAPARAAFAERGFTVHTPTLRHHELPLRDGAAKIASLSIRDYTHDLVALVASLDSPPLLVGHSLGGLLVQLVAAQTAHAGVVAACPSSMGPSGLNTTTIGIALPHAHKPRPWARAVYPPAWQRFRRGIASAQTEEAAREVFDDLVCESGRVLFFELAMPWLDRNKAARVDFGAVTGPVLVISGAHDRIMPPRLARRTAGRFANASYVEIPGSDHMVFSGAALPATMGLIDDWIATHRLFASV
ncbi:alpha/beta hydrolase [Mycobacterium sp. 852002-30065_SCH5024008]|uniref:alpha/beta hydrolase n=1 Tax=Mycobacterium sp. 852002-30065_SCH5024008 TaxID=1834088 RepID=UPI0008021040|nr:alpha/beta hydrolase [Mycobacterium sp. 852002-30065_SCH5024008]OBB92387.1 lysophospholipase [Mycobacterium sp. 852002-30065_SCH5024008]